MRREIEMAEVRTVSMQGGTHIITVPLAMVKAMGLRKGDKVVLEQPFMNSIVIRALLQIRESRTGDEGRTLGWITERERLDKMYDRVPTVLTETDCSCGVCRGWRAERTIVGLPLCKWCLVELATLVAFRNCPTQMEMAVR